MHDIFISYATPDLAKAEEVRLLLEQSGHSCWLAPRDIPGPTHWAGTIEAAIAGTRALFLVFSAAADQSPYVQREVDLAISSRKPILPLRLHGASPTGPMKFYLASVQWLDGSTPALPASAILQAFSVASGPRRWLRRAARAAVAAVVLVLALQGFLAAFASGFPLLGPVEAGFVAVFGWLVAAWAQRAYENWQHWKGKKAYEQTRQNFGTQPIEPPRGRAAGAS